MLHDPIKAVLSLGAHEGQGLSGEGEPVLVAVVVEGDPLLHDAAVAGVEAVAGTRGDEVVDAGAGELQDQAVVDEHGEDLVADLQGGGPEALGGSGRVGVAGEVVGEELVAVLWGDRGSLVPLLDSVAIPTVWLGSSSLC